MALARVGQADWSGGIYSPTAGGMAPDNTAISIENALIAEDGSLYKRGGTEYDSTTVLADIRGVTHAVLARGSATLVWTDAALYLKGAPTLTARATAYVPAAYSRPAAVGSFLCFRDTTARRVMLYAGSWKTANYTTGTVDVTQDSATVTGTGTAFLANVDPGMIFTPHGHPEARLHVVKSVESDTSLTLEAAFDGNTATGDTYTLYDVLEHVDFGAGITSIGSAGGRLLIGKRNRIEFSPRFNPITVQAGDYHELPASHRVIAIEGVGDAALVFSTGGVYRIDNLPYDATDAAGNVQHSVQLVNPNVVAWEEQGIASYGGITIVPALDDIYAIAPSGETSVLSEGIREMYRGFVASGKLPGPAVVHRGHYLLPIQDSGRASTGTMLVCDLDKRAWVEWNSESDGVQGPGDVDALAVRRNSEEAPELIGVSTTRLLDLSGCFDPAASNETDASGSAIPFRLHSRPFQVHPFRQVLWKNLRARVNLQSAGGGATISAAYDEGSDGFAETALSATVSERSSEDAFTWLVNKRAQSMSFELTSSDDAAILQVKGIEAAFRPTRKP